MSVMINHVSFAYQTSNVVSDVSLRINQGETVGIVGESGSGKTTLLKMMSGLLIPKEGEVLINNEVGVDANKRNAQVYNQVGVIFQDYQLFDHLTVVDNVALAYRLTLKQSKKQAKEKAIRMLSEFGLMDVKNQYPYECSGGQKQRIAIARALMLSPTILLLDEPTSALDQENTNNLVAILSDLQQEGLTIVIITHDLPFAKEVCNRMISMHHGKIIE